MFIDSKTIQDLLWSRIDTILKNGDNGQFWTCCKDHIVIMSVDNDDDDDDAEDDS